MQTLKAIIISAPSALREHLDRRTGKMTLLRHLALRNPGRHRPAGGADAQIRSQG